MKNITLSTSKKFSNSLITDIEFKNGEHTQMITIFNNDVLHFEEVNIGVNLSIKNIKNIKTSKNTFCVFRNGRLKESAFFEMKNY